MHACPPAGGGALKPLAALGAAGPALPPLRSPVLAPALRCNQACRSHALNAGKGTSWSARYAAVATMQGHTDTAPGGGGGWGAAEHPAGCTPLAPDRRMLPA